jgi:hypothetical protein
MFLKLQYLLFTIIIKWNWWTIMLSTNVITQTKIITILNHDWRFSTILVNVPQWMLVQQSDIFFVAVLFRLSKYTYTWRPSYIYNESYWFDYIKIATNFERNMLDTYIDTFQLYYFATTIFYIISTFKQQHLFLKAFKTFLSH